MPKDLVKVDKPQQYQATVAVQLAVGCDILAGTTIDTKLLSKREREKNESQRLLNGVLCRGLYLGWDEIKNKLARKRRKVKQKLRVLAKLGALKTASFKAATAMAAASSPTPQAPVLAEGNAPHGSVLLVVLVGTRDTPQTPVLFVENAAVVAAPGESKASGDAEQQLAEPPQDAAAAPAPIAPGARVLGTGPCETEFVVSLLLLLQPTYRNSIWFPLHARVLPNSPPQKKRPSRTAMGVRACVDWQVPMWKGYSIQCGRKMPAPRASASTQRFMACRCLASVASCMDVARPSD